MDDGAGVACRQFHSAFSDETSPVVCRVLGPIAGSVGSFAESLGDKRMFCILCGGPVRPLFSARDYRRPVDHTEYIINWCDKCEFGRLEGRFTQDGVKGFYDIGYYTHVRAASDQSASDVKTFWERLICHLAWHADRGVNFEISELGKPKERTVCDIGCGNGSKLKALRNAGFNVAGIEPDARARSLAKEVAEVFEGTAEFLPAQIHGRSFDIVLMLHVLEHCIDPCAALESACSILKPGGGLVIEVPNNAAQGFSTFKGLWPWSDIPRHINFFTERSLSSLLRSCGLEISSVRYVGYLRQFAPSWIKTQGEIWDAIGSDSRPKFWFLAWLLLAQTAFAEPPRKYDSVRIHASMP